MAGFTKVSKMRSDGRTGGGLLYLFIKDTKVQKKVKLYIAPVKPAPEGDGVFSGACWR